jgi:hypothetical protein
MLFNSFHLKIAFGLKGVKPSAANISFCNAFDQSCVAAMPLLNTREWQSGGGGP